MHSVVTLALTLVSVPRRHSVSEALNQTRDPFSSPSSVSFFHAGTAALPAFCFALTALQASS